MEIQKLPTEVLFSKIISEINSRLGSGVLFEHILDFTFEALDLIIPFDRIGIALLNENKTDISLFWMRSKIPSLFLTKNYTSKVSNTSLEKIIKNNQPRIINDLTAYQLSHPQSESTQLAVKDGIRSSLTYPLCANNSTIGVVFFSSAKPNTYSLEHIEEFKEIAGELSVLVEQAKLRNYFNENKKQTRTFSSILHDLKSPLGIIQGFLGFLKEEKWYKTLPADSLEIFDIIQRNTNYMLELLESYSELKQLDRESDLKVTAVNTANFISEISIYGKLMSGKKDIKFITDVDTHLPPVAYFEPQNIRRVLENLLINSIKFSKRGTGIRLEVRFQNNNFEFSIIDQGVGIPENEIPLLFKEFAKLSPKPTEKETSTGLGLAICKKIIDKHGGSISVTSKLNVGTTFKVLLPFVNHSSTERLV